MVFGGCLNFSLLYFFFVNSYSENSCGSAKEILTAMFLLS